jgi:hypothetical protein
MFEFGSFAPGSCRELCNPKKIQFQEVLAYDISVDFLENYQPSPWTTCSRKNIALSLCSRSYQLYIYLPEGEFSS